MEDSEKRCGLSGIGMIRSTIHKIDAEATEPTVHYVLFSKRA